MNRLSNWERCFPGRGQRAVRWDEKAQPPGLKPQALITSSLSCLIFLPVGSLAAGEGRTGGGGAEKRGRVSPGVETADIFLDREVELPLGEKPQFPLQ